MSIVGQSYEHETETYIARVIVPIVNVLDMYVTGTVGEEVAWRAKNEAIAWFGGVIGAKYGSSTDVDAKTERPLVEMLGDEAYFMTVVRVRRHEEEAA